MDQVTETIKAGPIRLHAQEVRSLSRLKMAILVMGALGLNFAAVCAVADLHPMTQPTSAVILPALKTAVDSLHRSSVRRQLPF